ncbi:MAG: tryptophan synthase subunit alpha [Chloroflexi bacterium]|nr:tryptophan synthase subunit alpha [Chloroflexota bacterium]
MPNRIDTKLEQIKASGQKALVPWVTVGFPDVKTSEEIAKAILESGGDMLEIGIPFSDPLADGPTIQMASFRALQQGVTLHTSLEVLRNLRKRGVDAPLIFMGYYNPYMRYGLEKFVEDAADAGLDGMIVPDLPPEEAGPFKEILERRGVYLIPLLAPTSTDQRIADACKVARGFIYCVSLAGVTGARQVLASGLSALVARIRRHTDLPVLVGFGISQREHVEEISKFADGAVVASALLNAIDQAPEGRKTQAARDFIKSLKKRS